MSEKNKVITVSLIIMTLVTFFVTCSCLYFLYHTAVEEQKDRLLEVVKSRAKLISAAHGILQRHHHDLPDPHDDYLNIETIMQGGLTTAPPTDEHAGHTPILDFIVGERRGDQIHFLVGPAKIKARPMAAAGMAETPMGWALAGRTGVQETEDHLGNPVISAFTVIEPAGYGLVAKIFLRDLRRPFIRAGLLAGLGALSLLVAGGLLMGRTVAPLVAKLEDALAEVKVLGGLLPICASCKNIRDDQGYWGRIESYISARSGVIFSHSTCPECLRKFYPDDYEEIEQELAELASRKKAAN